MKLKGKIQNWTKIHNISITPHNIPENAAFLFLRKIKMIDIVFVMPLAINNAIQGNKKF